MRLSSPPALPIFQRLSKSFCLKKKGKKGWRGPHHPEEFPNGAKQDLEVAIEHIRDVGLAILLVKKPLII